MILSSARGRRGVEIRAAAQPRPAAALEDVGLVYGGPEALEVELERRLLAALGAPPPRRENAWTRAELKARLAFHEAPAGLAARLVDAASAFPDEDAATALGNALDAALRFEPIEAELRRPVMVVGPPGAGKTATAAKLAVRAVLAGRPAGLITTDSSAGAASQIGTFAEMIRMPVETAESPEALGAAAAKLARIDGGRAVVVDTAGVNPFDGGDLSALRALIEASGAEPVLVLPAGGGSDLEDVAAAMRTLGARRILATKLDIARRLGGLLKASEAGGMALSLGSSSPYIAETLETLHPFALARRFLDLGPPPEDAP